MASLRPSPGSAFPPHNAARHRDVTLPHRLGAERPGNQGPGGAGHLDPDAVPGWLPRATLGSGSGMGGALRGRPRVGRARRWPEEGAGPALPVSTASGPFPPGRGRLVLSCIRNNIYSHNIYVLV